MPVITASARSTHELDGITFTSLATPSRGTAETSVWEVEIAPGTPGAPHEVTREELFVILAGRATVLLDGRRGEATAGDTVVVPPHTPFALANEGAEPVRALVCFPVGGQARADGATFTPPWAQ
jgi:quercetin dioxygenase-like cupin family protein